MLKNKRVFIFVLATIILFAGLAITIYLVRLNQDIRDDASSGAACQQSGDCVLLNNPGNSGSHATPRNILYIDITNQTEFRFNPGNTNDGCYSVSIQGNQVSWDKVGSGSSCKDISNIQIWMGTGVSTPTPTTQNTDTPTPTRNPSHTVTPTRNPSLTATNTPTPTNTGTVTPTTPPGSTNTPTPTPTPSEPPRGGGDTPTPTNTTTPTTPPGSTDTPTPTDTEGSIAATSPTPALPQAGVGTPTVFFSIFSMILILGAGAFFFL